MRLSNKVALVTGAASGQGRVVAQVFAYEQARVVVVDIDHEGGERTAELIRDAGGEGIFVPANVARAEDLERAIQTVLRQYGRLDILYNNAGLALLRTVTETTEEDWDATLRLNLDAPFFLAQRLAPAMIERGFGRIINIASLQSVRAFADCAPYGASKGAIAQLTRAQAQAWSRHGVNANAIAPGFFATELTAPVVNDTARWEAMAARTFVGRNGELPDLWGTALFLASRASNYVTGQTIFVDGGYTAAG